MVTTAVVCWVPTGSQLALCQAGQAGVPLCLNERAGRLFEITQAKFAAIQMYRKKDEKMTVEEGGEGEGVETNNCGFPSRGRRV